MFRYFAVAVLTIAAGVLLVVVLTRSDPTAAMINLTMVDYRFNPDHLTFRHDVRYRLHMENHGKETHEVTAPTFFATATIENPEVLNREHTEVVMQPGDVKDMYLTAHKPGTYDLRCSDHDWNGMVGGITVE
ncbi:MAG: cupredoxin domain-containing protein [Xanthobacteraceae bacterium]|jgi:uncharacterized cupredoxin-like copper-binding protein